MKRKQLAQFAYSLLSLSLCAILLTSCASSNSSPTYGIKASPEGGGYSSSASPMAPTTNEMAEVDEAQYYESEAMDNGAESPRAAVEPISADAQRKVIRTATFELQTKEYDQTLAQLQQKIAASGSYVQQSQSYGDKTMGGAQSFFEIRVPEDVYEDFKAFIPTIGTVSGSSEGGDDVTTQYFDTDARLAVLKTQEKRILELLEKSASVEEMLQIENELTRIRTQIEQLTTTLNRYDDLVSYGTIQLTVTQTEEAKIVVPDESFFSKMGKAIQSSLMAALGVLQNFVLVIIWLLPYLAVAAVILAIILVLRKRRRRTGNAGKTVQPLPPGIKQAPPAPSTDIPAEKQD